MNDEDYYKFLEVQDFDNYLSSLNDQLDYSIEDLTKYNNIEKDNNEKDNNDNQNESEMNINKYTIKKKKRCNFIDCNKKISQIDMISNICKCNFIFCYNHKMPESHKCTFNYKQNAQIKLKQNNPIIKASKLNRI